MAKSFDFQTKTEGADVLIDYGEEEGTYHVKIRVDGEVVHDHQNVPANKLHKELDSEHLSVSKAKAPKTKKPKKGMHFEPKGENTQVHIDYGAEEGTYDMQIRVDGDVVETHEGVKANKLHKVVDSDHVDVERATVPEAEGEPHTEDESVEE